MGHMSSSHQFAIMSRHAGQKNYHEVCTIYLSHSAISSVDCGKGSLSAPTDEIGLHSMHSGIIHHQIRLCEKEDEGGG